MPTADHLAQTRQELEDRYQFLTQRIQALQRDLDRELDGERQVVLRARLTEVSQERDRLAAQLETLDTQGPAILSGDYQLPDEPAPYRGLLPFQAQHARFFFGRDAERRQLADRLGRHPFMAVVGASGSGKSSLVRAGLIPDLAANALPDSSTWRVLDRLDRSHPTSAQCWPSWKLTPTSEDQLARWASPICPTRRRACQNVVAMSSGITLLRRRQR